MDADADATPMGRVDGMPHQEYLTVHAMSNSGLKRLRKSPWHYHALLRGVFPEVEPTREMLQGTVTHSLLLEPDTFDDCYAVGPEVSKNSNAWKAWKAENAGKRVIDRVMHETAFAMSDAIVSHPEVKRLWDNYPGASEVSFFWEERGVYSKARIDRLLKGVEGYIIVDLKTGAEVAAHAFRSTAARLGYAHQAAWYTRAVEAVTDEEVRGYVVVAAETTYPYAVTTYYFSEQVLAQANEHIDRLLDQYKYCEEMDDWPGYPLRQTIETMPDWAFDIRRYEYA